MTLVHHRFGSTTIAKIRNSDELRRLMDDPWLTHDTVVIKPNWISTAPGDFTDAKTLRILLEALDAPAVVVESYCLARSLNLRKQGLGFTADGKKVDWKWLLKGAGWKWLIENPDWTWFKQGDHWRHLILEEKAFLERYGFTDLFNEFDVTYINVTEEVWNGRAADPAAVKSMVESTYRPVRDERLYAMVPERLFGLRNATFISLARMKMYASYTLKNLFGMIPDPLGPYWHGPGNRTIVQNIIDINKIYHALFNVFGICEALFTLPVNRPDGKYEGVYSGRYDILAGSGLVAFGRNPAALDALLLHLTDPSIRLVADLNREPIERAGKELGLPVYQGIFKAAKKKVGGWFSAP